MAGEYPELEVKERTIEWATIKVPELGSQFGIRKIDGEYEVVQRPLGEGGKILYKHGWTDLMPVPGVPSEFDSVDEAKAFIKGIKFEGALLNQKEETSKKKLGEL